MHAFIQGIMAWYFGILDQFGLLGVVVLMAMESSIFPVPSELVVPPAAVVYLRDSHRDAAVILTFLVIVAGTVGSYIGAAVTYWGSRWLGRPLILKYGKYFFITEKKLKHADAWIAHYGASGIFVARLLPVVRHVISIPAGIMGMRFKTFSIMTLIGSFIWCTILAIFGLMMSKEMLVIINQRGALTSLVDQRQFEQAFSKLSIATLLLIGVALTCYWLLSRRKKHVSIMSVPSESILETKK